MKYYWELEDIDGEVSNSMFIFYLFELICMMDNGFSPDDDDEFKFIKRQFEEKGWAKYYEKIKEN